MNAKGLRILDIRNNKCIPLYEVLNEIAYANQLTWALLWCDVTSVKEEEEPVASLQRKVNESKDGLHCTFESLLELSSKIFQEIEILIIGCRAKEELHRYEEDQEMYETCDVVIEMVDGGFWEIFSKDVNLIDQLAKKYKMTEFLTSDFQNETKS